MPDWRSDIRRRLAPARLRPEREVEIADEVAQHLEDRYQSLIAAGHAEQDAEQVAWRELEDADVIGQRVAQVEAAAVPNLAGAEAPRHGGFAAGLWQDLRYAARGLRKHPLLSATVIATLALSLGPTTAVLGMADALFFKPVPGVARQDRLLNIWFGTARERGVSPWFISYADADDVTRDATTVEAVAGQQALQAGVSVEGSAPRLSMGAAVSANYFDVLGVRLATGRTFRPEEDRNPGGEPVVVLGEPLARGFFGSADAALGRTMLVNSVPFTVIGVAPQTFAGTRSASHMEFWLPGMAYARANNYPPDRWTYDVNRGPFYEFIVRMADGATVEQTMAELGARTRALAERNPDQNTIFETVGPILQPGFAAPASLRPTAVRAMQLIGGVAGLLVLLGMANVANLLIFRGLAAGRDVAIRKALGAGVSRLLQLRFVESLLLAVLGAAAGVGVALALGELISDFTVRALGALDVALDWRVVTATVALAVLVGAGFGLAPALLAVRESVTGALGRGLRTALPRATRLRHGLAVIQIALSLTLLVGALLFLATLRNLHAVDLGFDPTGVTMMNVNLRNYGYTDARALDYERRLANAVRREPGVQTVALAYAPPMLGLGFIDRVYLPGQDPGQATDVGLNAVSAEYFRVIGLPLVRGRGFTSEEALGDVKPEPMPVVVSQTLAERLFGTVDVIGRELRTPNFRQPPSALRIVGVTRTSHFTGVDSPPDALLYEPLGRFLFGTRSAYVLVRSAFGRAPTARLIREAATAIDPTVPLASEQTFDTLIGQLLGQQRLFAWMLGLLGTIGFVLAAVGLHGLVAQTVTERRREFGIRLAIGADRPRIMRLVLRRAAVVAVAGLVAGLTLAWYAGRIVESRLYGVTSRDPWIYAAAATVMAIVVAVASAAPARAATRVDPIEVLRSE
jgi:putative ABC transport system permease protein